MWLCRDHCYSGNFKNYIYKTGKDYKFVMAMGLSFTALTLFTIQFVSRNKNRRISRFVRCSTYHGKGIIVSNNCFILLNINLTFRISAKIKIIT